MRDDEVSHGRDLTPRGERLGRAQRVVSSGASREALRACCAEVLRKRARTDAGAPALLTGTGNAFDAKDGERFMIASHAGRSSFGWVAIGAVVSVATAGCGSSTSAGSPVGGGTRGGGGGGDASTKIELRLDGDACTVTSTNCDPACQLSCGANPRCTDLCCPETKRTGVHCGGVCQIGASCREDLVESCLLGWDPCDHDACAQKCADQACYDQCCSSGKGVYCAGVCSASCGGGSLTDGGARDGGQDGSRGGGGG
jgi:hypothetical protein